MSEIKWTSTTLPVKELKPYSKNPREFTKQGLDKLRDSIDKFGLADPFVINADRTLIGGHARHKVMMERDPEALVECHVPDRKLSDDMVKELNVRLNKNVAGVFDVEKLNEMFTAKDLVEIGFSIDELTLEEQEFVPPSGGDEQEEEDAEEEDYVHEAFFTEPLAKENDLFTLHYGEHVHKILCSDCLAEGAAERLLDGEKADIVITDPPYNLNPKDLWVTHKNDKAKGQRDYKFDNGWGEMNDKEFADWLSLVTASYAENSKDGSIHYIYMDWRHIPHLLQASEVYKEWKNMIVWKKSMMGMGTFYRSQHELVFVYKNGDAKHTNNFELGQYGRTRSNVMEYESISNNAKYNHEGRNFMTRLHPTVKPTDMYADFLDDTSKPGELVLDYFGGSGTAVLAAMAKNRRSAIMEMSPQFVDVCIFRALNWVYEEEGTLANITVKRNGRKLSDKQMAHYNIQEKW